MRRRIRRAVRRRDQPLPAWISGLLIGGTFAALCFLEWRRPLRRATESKRRRNVRNFAVAGLSAAVMQLAERPVVTPLAQRTERNNWGLLKQIRLPGWLEVMIAAVLLDYTLYLWHVLAHKWPFLWRFHQVHHVDLDLDASTALRFHFGELLCSILLRATQIRVFGVSPLALSVWQTALMVEILFHHSNVALPPQLERWVGRFIVTPRMHGIHHSMVESEANSNWSSGLTLWDWLHGTLRGGIPQLAIRIGVPAYADPEQVTFPRLVEMPFVEQRASWEEG